MFTRVLNISDDKQGKVLPDPRGLTNLVLDWGFFWQTFVNNIPPSHQHHINTHTHTPRQSVARQNATAGHSPTAERSH